MQLLSAFPNISLDKQVYIIIPVNREGSYVDHILTQVDCLDNVGSSWSIHSLMCNVLGL